MIYLICLIGGIVIGMNIRTELESRQYNKTYDQVDKQVRNDLAYYKNLSESLKQDLAWEKHRNRLTNKS